MPTEFTYRGKTIEELKNLDTREFAKFIPARVKRSLLRKFDKIERFVTKCEKFKAKGKQIKTHSRELVIVPKMIEHDIFVHNGKGFVKVRITPEMIGHRLGEFSVTRSKVKHGAAGVGATRSTAHASVK